MKYARAEFLSGGVSVNSKRLHFTARLTIAFVIGATVASSTAARSVEPIQPKAVSPEELSEQLADPCMKTSDLNAAGLSAIQPGVDLTNVALSIGTHVRENRRESVTDCVNQVDAKLASVAQYPSNVRAGVFQNVAKRMVANSFGMAAIAPTGLAQAAINSVSGAPTVSAGDLDRAKFGIGGGAQVVAASTASAATTPMTDAAATTTPPATTQGASQAETKQWTDPGRKFDETTMPGRHMMIGSDQPLPFNATLVHTQRVQKPDGTWVIVETFSAPDSVGLDQAKMALEDNKSQIEEQKDLREDARDSYERAVTRIQDTLRMQEQHSQNMTQMMMMSMSMFNSKQMQGMALLMQFMAMQQQQKAQQTALAMQQRAEDQYDKERKDSREAQRNLEKDRNQLNREVAKTGSVYYTRERPDTKGATASITPVTNAVSNPALASSEAFKQAAMSATNSLSSAALGVVDCNPVPGSQGAGDLASALAGLNSEKKSSSNPKNTAAASTGRQLASGAGSARSSPQSVGTQWKSGSFVGF